VQRARNFRTRLGWDVLPQTLRRIVVRVIGATIVLIGMALLVLPGPAFIVIPLGFLIFGSEFVWTRRLLRRAREIIGKEKVGRVKDLLPEEKR